MGICDLVSTGATLEANGLVEKDVIFRSKAVLIKRADGELSDEKETLVNRLVPRVDGVLLAKESKYIMLHAPKAYLEQLKSLRFYHLLEMKNKLLSTLFLQRPCSGKPWRN